MPRRRNLDPHVRVVHLSCGSEHTARSESARPRCDSDDPVFAVREGSGGRTRIAARSPLVCLAADRLPNGSVRASLPCRACGCRLRRSVGPALLGSVAPEAPCAIAETTASAFASLGYRLLSNRNAFWSPPSYTSPF